MKKNSHESGWRKAGGFNLVRDLQRVAKELTWNADVERRSNLELQGREILTTITKVLETDDSRSSLAFYRERVIPAYEDFLSQEPKTNSSELADEGRCVYCGDRIDADLADKAVQFWAEQGIPKSLYSPQSAYYCRECVRDVFRITSRHE